MKKQQIQHARRSLRFEQLEDRQMLSLTHWYTFNDGDATDLVGSNDLTLMNGAEIHSGVAVLRNDGVTSGQSSTVQYLDLDPAALPANGSATIEVWFYSYDDSNWTRLFDFGNQSGTGGDSYLFYTPQSSAGDSRFVLSSGGGGSGEVIASTETTNDDFKHLVSGVVDTATDSLLLYVDGELQATASLGGADMGSITKSVAYFGRSLYDADYGFTGMLDEVRIYDTALSASTIADHYSEGPTLTSSSVYTITSIGADADTYIRDSTPRGSSTVLDTMDYNGAGDYTTYVRFDLSGIDIDAITDATLYLYKINGTRTDYSNSGRFAVYGLTNDAGNTAQDWDEATLDKDNVGAEYSSADGVDTSQVYNLNLEAGADVAEHAPNTTYTVFKLSGPDLVAFLNDRVDDNGLVTFVTIVDAGAVRGWGYGSKEHPDTTLHPSLTIQHTSVAAVDDAYPSDPVSYTQQVEDLDRGVVAIKRSSDVYISWRLLATDPEDVAFNLYRISNGGSPVLVNTGGPITDTTDYVDTPSGVQTHQYFVRPIIQGIELGAAVPDSIPGYATISAFAQSQYYFEVPLQQPDSTYEANDASVGDLDGDGEYEIVLKWISSDAPIYVDAYELDGTHMWRIDLGQNVRTGTGGFAATLPFMVYDLDGDGKAEIAMNTAPGTKDALGNWVLESGDDPYANYINGSGYPEGGPEYFSVFDGETGALLANTDLGPAQGSVSDYGDNYGHRATTFKAAVAYLDGERPSVVIGRGIYHAIGDDKGVSTSKTEMTAHNWRDGQLTELWTFTATEGTGIGTNENPTYVGMGNHNLSVGDLDGDGRDEINWGAMAVDDDGTGLYSTGIGHGDSMHMSDMDPSNPGLEVFKPNENSGEYADSAAVMYDAQTGAKLVKIPGTGDIGRGVAGDIDPNSPGYELWATTDGYIYAADGTQLYSTPSNMYMNFLVWWDADLTRELLDQTTISEWNNPGRSNFILDPQSNSQYAPDCSSNNSTKATPALSGDIWGDWREEVIWRTSDNQALRIFSTPIEADTRMVTLMHDLQYREAIAWQNVYYNQPPHPGFFLGSGMEVPTAPDVYLASTSPAIAGDFNLDGSVNDADRDVWRQTFGTTQPQGYLPGDGDGDGDVDIADLMIWQKNHGQTSSLAAVSATVAPTAIASPAATTTVSEPEPTADEGLGAEPVDVALAVLGSTGSSTTMLPVAPALADQPAEEEPATEQSGYESTDAALESELQDDLLAGAASETSDQEAESAWDDSGEYELWDSLVL